MKKRFNLKCVLVLSFFSMLFGAALGQEDHTLVFDTEAAGEVKKIETWGWDTAWLNWGHARRSSIYMGKPQVDVVRFSFTGDWAITNGTLSAEAQAEFDERMAIVNTFADSHTALYLNNDTGDWTTNPYLVDTNDLTAGVDTALWAELIDVTTRACQDAGRTVVSVAPFNEPDDGTWQTGGAWVREPLNEVSQLLRTTYAATFDGIRIYGGSTLNNDYADGWYGWADSLGLLEEGNTHQLAGSFDTYAAFYETVQANGDVGANDELHGIMEAMVGAEYGMDTGIWWGPAELARGQFVKTSDGVRLAYAEDRPKWTAASVYRGTNGVVQAFVGESERQALPTTYRFFSKDRPVFYDGHGPQRAYSVTTTGGEGYMTLNHRGQDRVVNITWGDDVQPAIDGRYILVNRDSLKVMEVAGTSTNNGVNIQQYAYTNGLNQAWDVIPATPDVATNRWGDFSYYSITAAHSGSAADLDTGWQTDYGYGDGANLHQWENSFGDNQQWYFEYVEDGWFKVRNRLSDGCLAASPDGNIIQWHDDGTNSQQWRLIPVGADPADFTAPDQVTDVAATANPASVQLSWNANSESDLAGYEVLRSTTSGGPYEIIARGLSTNAYTDSSANQATPYYYVVKADDASLNRSVNSAQVSAAPTGAEALVAQYSFENNASDDSINGNDGELAGTAAYVTGGVGDGCLALDGGNGYFSLPAEVVNHDQVSIAGWVYWNGGQTWTRIFDFGNGTSEHLYLTPNSGSGLMEFTIKNGEGTAETLTTAALTSGEWTHVAVTLGSGTATIYTNGVIAATAGGFAIKPSDFNPVLNYIGRSQYDDPLFSGKVDDFRIYNYALAEADVADLASSGPQSAVSIPLTNPGFEEPNLGVIKGFDTVGYDVPGWSDINIGTGVNGDSGVEIASSWGSASGSYAASFKGQVNDGSGNISDAGCYQMTDHTIQEGDVFTVGYWAANLWAGGDMTVSLFGSDSDWYSSTEIGWNTTSGQLGLDGAKDFRYFEFEFAATPETVGQKLGVRFVNTTWSADGNTWTSLDDVTLSVLNTNAPAIVLPDTPASLTAVSTDAQISLSWNTASNATSYAVKYSLTDGGPYTVVGTPTATSYVHTGLANGTTYYYVVSALNVDGESTNSVQVSAVPSVAIATEEYSFTEGAIEGGTNMWLSLPNTVLGHTYGLLTTDSLLQPAWSNITVQAGSGSNLLFNIPVDGVESNRFFKLDVQRQ